MFIPDGVNHLEFYRQAQKKGIKVSSRFIGVAVNVNHGKHHWWARLQVNGKTIMFKRFPFTEQGERDAARQYQSFLASRDIAPRKIIKHEFKK